MSVLIGCATELRPNLTANTSIHNIRRNPEDELIFQNATRGDLARTTIWEIFHNSRHEWLLWVDGDQDYPRYTLTRLLSHGKLCISGMYFRREANPCFPIAFQDDPGFQWPMMPVLDWPRGGLIKIGATGFGAWLCHKSVLLDAWAEMKKAYQDEMVPLVSDGQMQFTRGDHQRVGADLRLGYFVRKAGHELWMDCGLPIGHCMDYFVGEEDYWRTNSNWKNRRYYDIVFEGRMKNLREGLKVADKDNSVVVNSIIENLRLSVKGHENAKEEIRHQIEQAQAEIGRLQSKIQELQGRINSELNPSHIFHDGATQEAQKMIDALIGGEPEQPKKE